MFIVHFILYHCMIWKKLNDLLSNEESLFHRCITFNTWLTFFKIYLLTFFFNIFTYWYFVSCIFNHYQRYIHTSSVTSYWMSQKSLHIFSLLLYNAFQVVWFWSSEYILENSFLLICIVSIYHWMAPKNIIQTNSEDELVCLLINSQFFCFF